MDKNKKEKQLKIQPKTELEIWEDENRVKYPFSQKMLGKTVFVVNHNGWFGEVEKVINWESFIIKNTKLNRSFEVSIWDIRSEPVIY